MSYVLIKFEATVLTSLIFFIDFVKFSSISFFCKTISVFFGRSSDLITDDAFFELNSFNSNLSITITSPSLSFSERTILRDDFLTFFCIF